MRGGRDRAGFAACRLSVRREGFVRWRGRKGDGAMGRWRRNGSDGRCQGTSPGRGRCPPQGERLTDPRPKWCSPQARHGKAAGSDGDAAPCARCSKKKSRRLHWPANTRARLTVGATATCRRVSDCRRRRRRYPLIHRTSPSQCRTHASRPSRALRASEGDLAPTILAKNLICQQGEEPRCQ